MSKSTEQIVTELADRDAIRELPQRYRVCAWRDDMGGIVNLFADDGVFTVIGSNRSRQAQMVHLEPKMKADITRL